MPNNTEHKTVALIEALLTERNILYKKFVHEPVRTSEEASKLRPEYTLAQGAKALIVRVKRGSEKSFAMVVVPGDKKFDSKKLKEVLGASDIRFATPEEVATITDGVQPGGVPPFGILWNISVYTDTSLYDNTEIIFNAGDRGVSIAISSADYRAVVEPSVVSIT